MKLEHYNLDGACHQARATLACLQGEGEIEESWSDEWKEYKAEPNVSRWENCREQGYVVYMRAENQKQINIAFFEHRNADSICAIEWNQPTINAPTIDTAKFGNIYKDKYDTSHSVTYGQHMEMGEWIKARLTEFWITNKKKP